MKLFARFLQPPKTTNVSFPLPMRWTEYWRTLSFDVGEFDDPSVYRPGLAMMSFGFALSCFTVMDLSKGGEANAVSFLKQSHFRDIRFSQDYRHQATAESLGFVFGRRKIKRGKERFTLIAVGIRGGHYGAEWGSNAKLGEAGPHQGFLSASERIHSAFLGYLQATKTKGEIAVWTVGYSRAGGVASLFADHLSRGLVQGGAPKRFGKAILRLTHIYAYTFAAPKSGEWNGDEYSFIHNVINPEDLVPRIPFPSFGFAHYGYERFLRISPEKEAELLEKFTQDGLELQPPCFTFMTLDFHHIFNRERRFVEDFTKRGGQEGFLDELCTILSSRLTRVTYAKFIQEGMVAIANLVDEQASSPYEKFLGFLKVILDGVVEGYGPLSLLGKVTSEKTDWKSILEPHLEKALEEEPELEEAKESILTALSAFLHFLSPSKKELLALYPTLREKENAKAVAFAHEPIRYYMLLLADEQ